MPSESEIAEQLAYLTYVEQLEIQGGAVPSLLTLFCKGPLFSILDAMRRPLPLLNRSCRGSLMIRSPFISKRRRSSTWDVTNRRWHCLKRLHNASHALLIYSRPKDFSCFDSNVLKKRW